jgi:hypothetical protein
MTMIPFEEEVKLFRSQRRWRALAIVLFTILVIMAASRAFSQTVEVNPQWKPVPELKWKGNFKTINATASNDPIKVVDDKYNQLMVFRPSQIRDWTLTAPDLVLHCIHEPIVTKDKDGRWLITFKP